LTEPTLTNRIEAPTLEAKYGRSVSLMQAAALLQVSRRTIYNRIRDGQLATIRIHGSQRVLTSSLFAKNNAQLTPQTPETAHSAQF